MTSKSPAVLDPRHKPDLTFTKTSVKTTLYHDLGLSPVWWEAEENNAWGITVGDDVIHKHYIAQDLRSDPPKKTLCHTRPSDGTLVTYQLDQHLFRAEAFQ